MDWALSKPLLDQLKDLQYHCLVENAGTYKRIARVCLLKELHIEPLEFS